ncbi:MAG: MBL fold metallo-hydrolase [Candidatus Accumulibacter sp.]|uniref:MBL fold metallo-hydrolase n=1 Tax=Accumulibacter sp. TaxID=2053492 RepID=UPI0025E5A2E7|nr:MBL fold metallo-hydrolase [Accumulibacter sp.]MCP5248826.1 MBL fold metallo-hydrolase [Accumulibacter sp.]
MLPEYPFATPPAAGATCEVAAGVHWLRMPLPFALNHINLWLLEDDHGWTIVDTGFALDTVKDCWQTILARLSETTRGGHISRIIVTHFHPDHLGLAAWLQEMTGAPIHMTLGEYLTAHAVWHEIGGHGNQPMLRQFRAHGLDGDRCAALERRSGGYNRGVPTLPTDYRRLMAGDELVIGEHRWRVRVGFGHSPEHAALYSQDLGVLISGDMLLPKISTNISVFAVTPMADSLADFLQSIDHYRELPAETLVLPSHGLPFHGIENRVNALHAHHEERLLVLEEQCTSPRSAAELLITLFPRDLDTHQTMFAMGEAIAHLNRLEHAGRLQRLEDDDGLIRFVRKHGAAGSRSAPRPRPGG